jgi:extradiol dioxygenase family protein
MEPISSQIFLGWNEWLRAAERMEDRGASKNVNPGVEEVEE